jgi:hypothetical protein
LLASNWAHALSLAADRFPPQPQTCGSALPGDNMDLSTQPGSTTVVDVQTSGVSWAAIAAGAVVAAALTLALVALGVGLGLSAVSPWSGSGVGETTFKLGSGVWLVATAMIASSVGGYLAARLRTRWVGVHNNEVFFRDTAHGLITWAFATVLTAAALGSATNSIVSGVTGATTQAAARVSPIDTAVDSLFRTDPAAAPAPPGQASGPDPMRAEISRLLTTGLRDGGNFSATDRTYVARVVASRTGISQADAEKRVTDVIETAKQEIDDARKAAARLSFWLTASLLMGAFSATLAAVEGGQLRDGTWNERKLVPRTP